MRGREGQQIAVRYLSRRSDLCGIDRAVAEEADVIGPEAMALEQTELADDLRGLGRRAGRVRIARMADDANNPVLRDRTAGPVLAAFPLEPEICGIVTAMRGIDQRDQNIHVEQEGHGDRAEERREWEKSVRK